MRDLHPMVIPPGIVELSQHDEILMVQDTRVVRECCLLFFDSVSLGPVPEGESWLPQTATDQSRTDNSQHCKPIRTHTLC